MKTTTMLAILAAAAATTTSARATVTVWSNNPAPGDAFTHPSGTSTIFTPGAALVANPGFYYNNVRSGAVVGIRDNLPRNGNGSAWFNATEPPGGQGKADVEYIHFQTPGNPLSGLASMGALADLSHASYEWYRLSAFSTVASHYHPVLRLYYDADGNFGTTTDCGYLIFERAYNPAPSPVPVDQWVLDDVFNWNGPGQSANLWMVNFGNPSGSVLEIYNRTLQDWLTSANPNAGYPSLNNGAVVYGFSVGVGSGWSGTFSGAVDTVTIGFGGVSTTYNFEVVPSPGGLALLAMGGLACLRRRR